MTAQPVSITSNDDDVEGSAAKRAHGSSFYAAMRIMPPGQREAMFEIYSFCRAVDDIADDMGPKDGRLEALQKWRDDLRALYAGTAVPGLKGLAASIAAFNLKHEDFLAIIDGMEMDILGPLQAPDFQTLDLYCDRVASAVGRLSVRVFGLPEQDGLALAHSLGRALQLTNILRDLDEDAAMDRLYLPREYLEEAGIHTTRPAEVLRHPGLESTCLRIAKLARDYFATSDAIMAKYPRKVVRTPRVMSEAYKCIHAGLLARGFTGARPRVRLAKSKLVFILVRYMLF